MKVSISHSEKTEGLFAKRKYYVVDLTVTFTEEERQTIEDGDLSSTVVIDRPVPADRNPAQFRNMEDVFNLTIYKLLKGTDSYAFATAHEAKAYDLSLRETLPRLKDLIIERGDTELTNDSFEI